MSMTIHEPAPDYVRSISAQAKKAGVGHNTLRRMIARGEGPRVIKLSARRLGIRDSAMETWLASRESDAV